MDPVTGEIKTAKQPYFLHLAGKPAFAFAGLMSWAKDEAGQFTKLTASIITRAAEGQAADVHTRMPLILPREAEREWMDREMVDGAKALEMAQGAAVTDVQFHAVSSRVNSSKNTGEDLIEPFPNPA